MSNTKSKRHTHKYHKIIIAGNKVWACALPDCQHYMPKHMEQMVMGKNTYCWGCDDIMQLDSDNMKNDRPICISCANPELIGQFESIDKVIP